MTVTRICHSCVLIDFGGATILTDPWFSQKPIYHPGEPIAYAPGQLPSLAGVFISHGHYDHCDLGAFAAYPDHAVAFAVKRGLGARVRAAGFANVTELDPWETAHVGPVTITAAPAKHFVPEITAVIQNAERTVFFGADTLHIPQLADVAARFPRIDLALLPINGLRIRPLLNKKVVMDADRGRRADPQSAPPRRRSDPLPFHRRTSRRPPAAKARRRPRALRPGRR